jgi:magnesium chelatase family protein
LRDTPWFTNGEVPAPIMRRRWPPASGSLQQLERLLDLGLLSARAFDRIVRVAWTIADLAGKDRPGVAEVGSALGLRVAVAA